MLSREQILSANTRPVAEVECPALGGTVCLRALSGAEMTRIYQGGREATEVVQDLVALSLCDSEGVRLFGQPGDGRLLYEAHNAQALEPIVTKAMAINRLTKEAVDDARKA